MARTPQPVIEAQGLDAAFARTSGAPPVAALNDVSFTLEAGEFAAVIGRSGAGKTTLMRCLTGFVRPSAGHLLVNGVDIATCGSRSLRRLRCSVASIHQHFNLVERATAFDNVLIGRLGRVDTLRSLLGWFPRRDREIALETLGELDLAERAHQRCDRLSGGERQRVAIARALVQQPGLVLADEPAASLDVALTRAVLDTLQKLNRDHGLTVLVSLHDLDLARVYARRLLALRQGRLVFDGTVDRLNDRLEEEIYNGAEGPGTGGTVPEVDEAGISKARPTPAAAVH